MKNKIIKDWQSREKSKEELHNDSKLWISEINFINDEIRFLEHLLSINYIDCISVGLYDKIKILVGKMTDERLAGETLLVIIKEQEAILSDLIKTDSVLSNKNYLKSHRKLELEIKNFSNKYRRIKKQIFEVIRKMTMQKELKKLT